MLAVIETHPVQYHAPVYRWLQQQCGVPVTAIYGSDFSVAGYRDHDFRESFAWKTDLLSGYSSEFLSRTDGRTVTDADVLPTAGMAAALRRVQPDAVMVVGYSPRFHRTAWYQAWRLGAPILFRGETTDVAKDRSTPKAAIRDLALRVAYARCQALLYIGRHSRAHFIDHRVPESRLYFSPYCVDATTFEPDEVARGRLRSVTRKELGISDEHFVVLFVGKFLRRKGVDLIPPAFEGLPPAVRSRLVLLCVGEGELRQELQMRAASTGLATRFVGFRNQGELSRYYHAADVMLLPSRSETWGLVVNEALLHGVPCVVSHRVGCSADLIEPDQTGTVFISESVGALREAFLRAMPLARNRHARAACRQKVASYSVEVAARGIADAYAATTRERRR